MSSFCLSLPAGTAFPRFSAHPAAPRPRRGQPAWAGSVDSLVLAPSPCREATAKPLGPEGAACRRPGASTVRAPEAWGLAAKDWAPAVYNGLQAMLTDSAKAGGLATQPVAALDFDDTLYGGDCTYNCYHHLLAGGDVRLTPDELAQVLRAPGPAHDFRDGVHIPTLRDQIRRAYDRLYAARQAGRVGDDDLHPEERPHLHRFRTLAAYFCAQHEAQRQHEVDRAPLWLEFLAGRTCAELGQLAVAADIQVARAQACGVSGLNWTCAANAQLGALTYTASRRAVPLVPMQRLMHALDAAHFDVYVVSGGVREIVAATLAHHAGYPSLAEGRLLANWHLQDDAGRILPQQHHCAALPRTYGRGKAEQLDNRAIGPLLVAGDGDGDLNLFTDLSAVQVRLFIDHGRPSS